MDFTVSEFGNIRNPRFKTFKIGDEKFHMLKEDYKGNALPPPEQQREIETPVIENPVNVANFFRLDTPVEKEPRQENIRSIRSKVGESPTPAVCAGVGLSICRGTKEISLSAINPSPEGQYLNMNATVNERGQIISASSGTKGTVTSITCGEGLRGGIITRDGDISLLENGITSKFLADNPDIQKGNYICPEITVDQKGLIIDIKNGSSVKRIEAGPGLIVSILEPGVIRLDIGPSVSLTGKPTAPTPEPGRKNTQLATTAYVDSAVENAIQAIIAAMTNSK